MVHFASTCHAKACCREYECCVVCSQSLLPVVTRLIVRCHWCCRCLTSPQMSTSFASFDWDHDERWLDYLRRVEIPSGSIDAAKRKWFKRTVDPAFGDASAPPPPRPQASQAPQASTQGQPNAPNREPGPSRGASPSVLLQNVWLGKCGPCFVWV